jgi:hypothetical protein
LANQQETPWELFFGARLDLSTLRAFGSKAYVHVPKEQRNKLALKSETVILVGYPLGVKGYSVYLGNNKVVTSRDCIFDERPVAIELPLHTTSDPFIVSSVDDDSTEKQLTDAHNSGSGLGTGARVGDGASDGDSSGASSSSDSDNTSETYQFEPHVGSPLFWLS